MGIRKEITRDMMTLIAVVMTISNRRSQQAEANWYRVYALDSSTTPKNISNHLPKVTIKTFIFAKKKKSLEKTIRKV